jgi:ferredoxin-NADP reductase
MWQSAYSYAISLFGQQPVKTLCVLGTDKKELAMLESVESEGAIISIRVETHDVKTFVLRLGKKFDFVPGQYCMVSMPANEQFKKEWRPFTFANTPDDEDIELTVKRIGVFTQAMHNLKVGDTLLVKGPLGEKLNFDDSVKDDVVFLAGGSGITPFMSAIRFAVSRNLPNQITLLYSNKTVDDIIYKDELEELSKRENLTVINSLTNDIPQGWEGSSGRIDRDMILSHVNQLNEKLWYVCGPPPMVEQLKKVLQEIGVPGENLRIEDWQLPGKVGL